MNKRVLVTGGTGLLGSCVLRLLVQQGYAVRATRRTNSRMDLVQDIADQVEWANADVTDLGALEDAFEGITHVIHCAAVVSFRNGDASHMHHINVDGTANVVNLCLAFGVQQLIHVSSIAAIGREKNRIHLDEKCKWVQSSANSRYAISKYASEQEVWRGQAEGLNVAIVNPAIIIGGGFWDEGSVRFFRQVDKGMPFYPIGQSGFVDVRDVARFMLLLLKYNRNGERYILSAENVPYKTFFESIALALGKKPPSIAASPFLAEIAWRVEWLREKLFNATPMVTKETARSSVSTYFYSNEKSKKAFFEGFGYRAVQTSIEETAQLYLSTKEKGSGAMST
jgi:dihydroflavonol-4-reductase